MAMVADDAKLMRSVERGDSKFIQDALDKSWFRKWLIDFNASKCIVMKMGTRGQKDGT